MINRFIGTIPLTPRCLFNQTVAHLKVYIKVSVSINFSTVISSEVVIDIYNKCIGLTNFDMCKLFDLPIVSCVTDPFAWVFLPRVLFIFLLRRPCRLIIPPLFRLFFLFVETRRPFVFFLMGLLFVLLFVRIGIFFSIILVTSIVSAKLVLDYI